MWKCLCIKVNKRLLNKGQQLVCFTRNWRSMTMKFQLVINDNGKIFCFIYILERFRVYVVGFVLPRCRTWHLDMLNGSCQNSDQDCNLFKSFWSLSILSSSTIYTLYRMKQFTVIKSLTKCKQSLCRVVGRSLTKTENSSHPKIEPWGIPLFTCIKDESNWPHSSKPLISLFKARFCPGKQITCDTISLQLSR